MAYRADSEDFEEEEEEEEEEGGGEKVPTESAEEGDVIGLVAVGDGNMHGRNRSKDSESRGSRHSCESSDDGQLSDSVHEDDSTGNNDGAKEAPVCHSNNSDKVGGGGQDHLSPPRMVSSGEFESDLDYNEDEDDQRRSRPAEKRRRKGSDEGELSSDDEEGEIKERFYRERDNRPRYRMRKSRSVSPDPQRFDTSICRHYLAGTCDWGRSCRFRHPPADELIELKGKGMLPPDHRSRRHEGREGWSNLRGTPSHRYTHPHDGPAFGPGLGFGAFPGRYHDYPAGDFGHRPYTHGPYPPAPYMDHGRPSFSSGWMGYGQDSQGGMQEESDGWIRLKMPVVPSSWDMDDGSPPSRHKKKRRREHSSESENSDEEGKLKAKKKKKKKTKKHKESDSEESSSGQRAERKKKKRQKQKEIEHTSNSDGEDVVSKSREKKAKQRKQQQEDSQEERATDSGKEKKSTKEKSGSLSRSSEWKKTRQKDWPERSLKEEGNEVPRGHKYREIQKELQIVTAAINRRTKTKR